MNIAYNQYNQPTAIVIIVMNCLSFISLGFVIIVYLINWNSISSFPTRLSLYLCIACFIQNLYVILLNPILVHQFNQNSTSSNYCIFQAILKIAFDLSSMIWTFLIMYTVHRTVVLQRVMNKIQIFYLVLAYVAPIIAALIPAFFNIYGYDTYFCWFSPQNLSTQFGFKMGYFFVPLWIFFIFSLLFSILTYKKLKSIGLPATELTFFKRFILFPFILFISGIFGTIDLIYTQVTGDYALWLDILSNIMLSLYGLLNAIAYGLNPIIRQQIVKLFVKQQVPSTDRTSEMTSKSSKISQLIEKV